MNLGIVSIGSSRGIYYPEDPTTTVLIPGSCPGMVSEPGMKLSEVFVLASGSFSRWTLRVVTRPQVILLADSTGLEVTALDFLGQPGKTTVNLGTFSFNNESEYQ